MQADCETQKSVPTVRWGFPWQPQQREDTGLPSLSSSFSPLSPSVSRVIKDCTLINFSALSRAKCPGRGLCVCAHVCLCACVHVQAPGFVMYASLVLEYIPVIHSAVFTFALKRESVHVYVFVRVQHNLPFNFLL